MFYLDLGAIWVYSLMTTSFIFVNGLSRIKVGIYTYVGWIAFAIIGYFLSFATQPWFFLMTYVFACYLMYGNKNFWNATIPVILWYLFLTYLSSFLPYMAIDYSRPLVNSTKSLLWLPLFPLIALITTKGLIQLKKQYEAYPHIVPVVCSWQDQVYQMEGFIDSGNRSRVEGLPIVLLNGKHHYRVPHTIMSQFYRFDGTLVACQTFKGKVQLIPGKVKDVLFAIVPPRDDFYGCECLLNPLI